MGVTRRAAKGSAISSVENDTNWNLFAGAAVAKTLATDAFAADVDFGSGAGKYIITSESGTADDLSSITGTTEGDVIKLFAVATHTITVTHGVGNIRMAGGFPFEMVGPNDFAELRNVNGTTIVGVGFHVP